MHLKSLVINTALNEELLQHVNTKGGLRSRQANQTGPSYGDMADEPIKGLWIYLMELQESISNAKHIHMSTSHRILSA